MIFCKNLNISLYSNLFIIILIALINCLLQFAAERLVIKSFKLCNQETLIKMCKEANISEQVTKRLIMKYVEHKTIKEIAIIECVEEQAVKMSINRAKKKLNFD